MSNYQLPDQLREARAASIEIGMLLRSIRMAVESAEASASGAYGLLSDASVHQREAAKIQLLAARISALAATTAWPTARELAQLDRRTVSMLLELADDYDAR